MDTRLYLKVVFVGDAGVGKTCLITTYDKKSFPREYVPTQADPFTRDLMVDGKTVNIGPVEVVGQEKYAEMRHHLYPQTDIFFLCFSVENPESFANVESKWLPEIRHHCPVLPTMLVACKIDLRSTCSGKTVTYDEGFAVAKRNGLLYAETSALTKLGLNECFDNAVRGYLYTSRLPKSNKRCTVV